MSKIIGHRLLLIPCKQTRRLCAGILSMLLHFPWQNKYFEASALLSPWGSIYIQDKISFLHFTFLDSCMWYFPLGISNRATRKASAQCTVTALLLRWQAPMGNKCPLIRGLVARSFLTWKTLFFSPEQKQASGLECLQFDGNTLKSMIFTEYGPESPQ